MLLQKTPGPDIFDVGCFKFQISVAEAVRERIGTALRNRELHENLLPSRLTRKVQKRCRWKQFDRPEKECREVAELDSVLREA